MTQFRVYGRGQMYPRIFQNSLLHVQHRVHLVTLGERILKDIIDEIVEKLKNKKFKDNNKIGFLAEQLGLLFKRPNARRYSPSMFMAALLHGVSPACYKQLYNNGFLTLPSPSVPILGGSSNI